MVDYKESDVLHRREMTDRNTGYRYVEIKAVDLGHGTYACHVKRYAPNGFVFFESLSRTKNPQKLSTLFELAVKYEEERHLRKKKAEEDSSAATA